MCFTTLDKKIFFKNEEETLSLAGRWQISQLDHVESQLANLPSPYPKKIDLSEISKMDASGAWLICKYRKKFTAEFLSIPRQFKSLFELVDKYDEDSPAPEVEKTWQDNFITLIGQKSVSFWKETLLILTFFGHIVISGFKALKDPKRIRLKPLIYHIQHVGVNSLLIVGLTTCLIGVVIAYMGSIQLKKFQAEIFTLDLVAISILREIGILLTAIMISGRSGSSFTAQIGTMKINEEIDAMQTMGIHPMDSLVLPRLLSMIIVMPLLTFYADIMGLLGGAIMGVTYLGIGWMEVLDHFNKAITGWHFWTGMIKAPLFGIVISVIGCYHGLRVRYNAESIGQHTTKSVVESIFIVIVLDALLAVFYGEVGI